MLLIRDFNTIVVRGQILKQPKKTLRTDLSSATHSNDDTHWLVHSLMLSLRYFFDLFCNDHVLFPVVWSADMAEP